MKKLIMFSGNEYKKLFMQIRTKIILALFVLCALVVGLVSFLINRNTGVQMTAPGQLPVFVLNLLTGLVLPVLAIFIASELFAGEFKDGTIKNVFALPVSKSIIYVGKLLAGAAVMGTCLLGLGISSVVAGVAVNGFEAFGNIGGVLVSYLGAFIYLLVALVIAGFISLLTGSPSMAIVVNLLIWLGLGFAGTFIAAVKGFLPTNFESWYQPLMNGVNMTAALPPLLFMISYGVVFIVTGMMIFEKKEV